jgi:tRNA intron endonuclease, catalytic C-terminal domain
MSPVTSASASASASSFMAHAASLVMDMSDNYRLPPTYVGVRRVRPSTKEVQSAWVGATGRDDILETAAATATSTAVVFKVMNEDGTERRMTTKEKKDLKIILRKESNCANKKRKSERKEASRQHDSSASKNIITASTTRTTTTTTIHTNNNDSRYHQLQVNNTALEEELADLRGDRRGVPPVLLSPPMTLQAKLVILNEDIQRPRYQLDDNLSKTWAISIKQGMQDAEQIRNGEDMRPMAYQVVPEVWTRLRPDTLNDGVQGSLTPTANDIATTVTVTPPESSWSLVTIRQNQNLLDSANVVIIDLLYHHSKLHVSCGVKFGCDYLLYDGPRHERHAFAGLRVLSGPCNPYDLAGYVRGLNTAGKLALVAKVEADGKVALVDLALEKILTAPTHVKRKRYEARKVVGQKLAKSSN